MIVVMDKNAVDEQIENVTKRVQELGLKAHVIRGTERTVIAAVGDERMVKVESFESYPGVSEVMPILAPYKMASRELKPEATQIKVLEFRAGRGAVGVMGGPCSVESALRLRAFDSGGLIVCCTRHSSGHSVVFKFYWSKSCSH